MPNKDRNKRSVRKARAEERARSEAAAAQSVGKAAAVESKKAPVKAAKKPAPERKRSGGLFGYLREVRVETKRVVWPSAAEVRGYTLVIIATLILFGLVIWLVDSGIVAALIAFTSLRG